MSNKKYRKVRYEWIVKYKFICNGNYNTISQICKSKKDAMYLFKHCSEEEICSIEKGGIYYE